MLNHFPINHEIVKRKVCWTRIITVPVSISRKIPCGWWHRVMFSLVHSWNEGSVDGGVPSNWMYQNSWEIQISISRCVVSNILDRILSCGWYPLIPFDSTIDYESCLWKFHHRNESHKSGSSGRPLDRAPKSWTTTCLSIGQHDRDSADWPTAQSGSYGGFLKWWYPTIMGFPTKNYLFGCFGGTTI